MSVLAWDWTTSLCERSDCYRGGPHFPGEYGCAESLVWRCPKGVDAGACCAARRSAPHRPGCGCPGDPKAPAPRREPPARMPEQEPVRIPGGAL